MGSSIRELARAAIAIVVITVLVRTAAVLLDARTATAVVGCAAVVALAAGLLWHGRRHGRGWAVAWLVLLVALTAHVVASLVWGHSPVVAGTVRLAADVVAIAGLYLLIRHRRVDLAAPALFAAVVGALAVAWVLWVIVVEPSELPRGAAFLAVAVAAAGLGAFGMLVRLVLLSSHHPLAYRYLGAGLVLLLTAAAVDVGAILGRFAVSAGPVSAVLLVGYCLWAAAAFHPSLGETFEPVPVGSSRVRWPQVLFGLAAVVLAPAAVILEALRGHEIRLPVVLAGSTALSVLVLLHLVWQLHRRVLGEDGGRHDALTGLPNRALFDDRLDVALAQARRSGESLAVMFLDLDRFKNVNDTLGHDAGNQLLRGAAVRLRRLLREEDTVARWGGDEFTLLLPNIASVEDAETVAAKILDSFADPFQVQGREIRSNVSVGVAVFPHDGTDRDTLLKNADTAMYRAKGQRGTYQLYTAAMSARTQIRVSLEAGLLRAIERDELMVHYQPQVDLIDGRLVGVEALVRWLHPELGFISPGTFVPLAEESGLIGQLGEWVLREACRQHKVWSEGGVVDGRVAVNISAHQIAEPGIVALVADVLAETGLPPSQLELELTESVFLRDLDAACANLRALRDLGVRCSIDDFGTGFSGLNYLTTLPIDKLKIDRSFVMAISGVGSAIIDAILSLAKSLHVSVLAEGVETAQQAQFLREHGCHLMQGYMFGRPMPPDELERLVRVRHGWGAEAFDSEWREPLPRVATSRQHAATIGATLWSAVQDQDAALDAITIDQILEAFRASEDKASRPRIVRPGSVRMAVGTFATVIPLSSGMAAAGALPNNAQVAAHDVLGSVGLSVPPTANAGGTRDVVHGGRGKDDAVSRGVRREPDPGADQIATGPPDKGDHREVDPSADRAEGAGAPASDERGAKPKDDGATAPNGAGDGEESEQGDEAPLPETGSNGREQDVGVKARGPVSEGKGRGGGIGRASPAGLEPLTIRSVETSREPMMPAVMSRYGGRWLEV